MGKIKTMLPFLAVIALIYYFIPSMIVLLVVVPVVCLLSAIIYSTNNSFSILYAIFVIILFVPLALVIYTPLALFLAVGYGIVALIGNAIGTIFFKRNRRIKIPKKFGRYVMIAVVVCYSVTVIISAIMMSQMAQITYKAYAFGTTIREDIIDFETNTAQRKYYDYSGEQRSLKENSFSAVEKYSIKLICSFSLFPLWLEDYFSPGIMDGDQYSICRGYQNRESMVYGSNAYPLTYNLVFYAIDNAFE